MDLLFRPFGDWAHPETTKRRTATSLVGYNKVFEDLERELRPLGASKIVIATGHAAGEIGNDGRPRSSAKKPWHPGVQLLFLSKYGVLSFVCDTFTDWQGNLRAIGQTLQALRAVDQYGVVKGGVQYKGFLLATSGTASSGGGAAGSKTGKAEARTPKAPKDPLAEAAKLLLVVAGREATEATIREVRDGSAEGLQALYRAAVLVAHPDIGGSDKRFRAVVAAMELLRESRTT